MKWRVFKKEDPDIWPEFDCPLLVCWTSGDEYRLYNAKWDYEDKQFVSDLRWLSLVNGDIFYCYIHHIPCIISESHPVKCCKDDRCEYDDDGYCLCEDYCRYKKQVTEYSLGSKSIWKAFGTA